MLVLCLAQYLHSMIRKKMAMVGAAGVGKTSLVSRVLAVAGDVPFILLVNKSDLEAAWQVTAQRLDALRDAGWDIVATSAKQGQGVEEAFERLARRMLQWVGLEAAQPGQHRTLSEADQKLDPGSFKNATSSGVLARARILLRWGKRPKRATMTSCLRM